ncbi:hypothetical protein HBO34_15890 [Pseudomonas veronii]|uniref:hypothetical protein n=1 Tax=Pseudomonas veronii TaxID=76761 RepID=UPI0014731AA1|nr:hypothetical protein [Pseudomonas veronii]NMX39356.1 hypothetical protein [Pseudomonas veronii]
MGGLLLQNGKQAFTDANSRPLSGGKVFFYAPGTQMPRDTWQDPALTVLNTNPVILDARGEASIYGLGAYRQVLRDASNVLIWDQVLPDILGVVNDAISSFFLSNLTVVPSIAALRLLDSTVRKNAFATGYYAPGDLGGGAYYLHALDTSTPDNGGSVIVGADGGRWKLTKTDKMNVAQFGAKNDGSDATTFINKAITALPAGGTLSGSGLSYSVTSCLLKSYMILEDVNLMTLAGTLDFASPITINGTVTAKTNITLKRVHVDGNRANQTNIVSPGEDGGRNGFRIIGTTSNLLIEDCSANYCACDGIEFFSSASHPNSDITFVFMNIDIIRFRASYNRRHGLSAESIYRVSITDSLFSSNGLDLNTVDAYTVGTRGARFPASLAGNLYGSGMDWEGYGIGSGVNSLRMQGVECSANNRSGAVFFNPVLQTDPGFYPWENISISDCLFDAGVGGFAQSNWDGSALQFTSTLANKAGASVFRSVMISNTSMSGKFISRCASAVTVSGGQMNWSGDTYIALLDYAFNHTIGMQTIGSASLINASNSTYNLGPEALPWPADPVLSKFSGSGSLSGSVVTRIENSRDRFFSFLITSLWTPTAAGIPIFNITPSGVSTIVSPPEIGLLTTAGTSIACDYLMSAGNFRFSDPATGAITIQIVVKVKV